MSESHTRMIMTTKMSAGWWTNWPIIRKSEERKRDVFKKSHKKCIILIILRSWLELVFSHTTSWKLYAQNGQELSSSVSIKLKKSSLNDRVWIWSIINWSLSSFLGCQTDSDSYMFRRFPSSSKPKEPLEILQTEIIIPQIVIMCY